MTAPTPERRVGEEWVKEIAALPLMDGSVGLPRLGLPKSSAAFPHFCRVHNGQVALAGDLLDAAKEVARLTAEVERLTKEKAEAVSVARELEAMVSRWAGSATCHEQSARLAALSLPTHAEPEVKNDKS